MKIKKICIVGLGYVGLPLMALLAKYFDVTGFDIDRKKIDNIRHGHDQTGDLSDKEIDSIKNSLTDNILDLIDCSIYIVTVPTPIDSDYTPDLSALKSVCYNLLDVLKKGDLIVFESTVYPGTTQEVLVPILEQNGLVLNKDFSVGYSPERVNPGDRTQTIDKIVKVISASNDNALMQMDEVYSKVTKAGIHVAESIEIAEAAKLIENVQRDVNIALINEISKTLNIMNIDVHKTLTAAGTKWNFNKYIPGLVGGHCIGVDPYYLTSKAQSLGIYSELVLASRRINDGMSRYYVDRIIRYSQKVRKNPKLKQVLILGFTFKENCPDIRNTKIYDVYKEFEILGSKIVVIDPYCDVEEAYKMYGITILRKVPKSIYDIVFLGVNHDHFVEHEYKNLDKYTDDQSIIFDLKSILPVSDRVLRA